MILLLRSGIGSLQKYSGKKRFIFLFKLRFFLSKHIVNNDHEERDNKN